MKEILYLVPYHPTDEGIEYIKKGGTNLPLHHLWGYDQIPKYHFKVSSVKFDDQTLLNKLGRRFFKIANLQQQINVLKNIRRYDLIYNPFMDHDFLLILLRYLRILNIPMISIAQTSWTTNKKNWLKRLKYNFVRYLYFKSNDAIIFLNENTFEYNRKNCNLKGHLDFFKSWGVDFDFFKDYVDEQSVAPTNDYIFSSGGTARDFDTLIKAFHGLDFNLKISGRSDFRSELSCSVSSNVCIDLSVSPGIESTGLLRSDYYNALAVAVPLKETSDLAAYGSTVLMEAMAMGKPVISTLNPIFPFDIEKEKIGFSVDYGDVQGWQDAINYLREHPEEAKQMGIRGTHLIQTKFNYNSFSKELIAHIKNALNGSQ